MDSKFSEFENAAIQREKDYKNIIEQQRLDSEQLKGFEKLKEANLELRAVRNFPFFLLLKSQDFLFLLNIYFYNSIFFNLIENSKDSRELSAY